MPNSPAQKGRDTETNCRWLSAIDDLLIAGLKLGPAKKRDAINQILRLVPQWTRKDCWTRIRHLRRTSVLAPVEEHNPDEARKSSKARSARRPRYRSWTPADDDRLLNLAGYEPVKKIAQRLGRSIQAVRFRLGALGMSARVTDGWSLRTLQTTLRLRRPRLRQFIGSGMLKVRDPHR